MTERDATVAPSGPGTMPIVVGTGATAVSASDPAAGAEPAAPGTTTPAAVGAAPTATPAPAAGKVPEKAAGPAPGKAAGPAPGTAAGPAADPTTGVQPTAPVAVRPKARLPRRGPMTVMGPWAPVAGGLLGLLVGLVVVLLLAGSAGSFEDRLALAFTVVGLAMLGTAGTLLADEVGMMRRQAREAAVRPQWVESTASLLNGATPARLLLAAGAFVLFLAAFVSRG